VRRERALAALLQPAVVLGMIDDDDDDDDDELA
jgi:hypothetical protein